MAGKRDMYMLVSMSMFMPMFSSLTNCIDVGQDTLAHHLLRPARQIVQALALRELLVALMQHRVYVLLVQRLAREAIGDLDRPDVAFGCAEVLLAQARGHDERRARVRLVREDVLRGAMCALQVGRVNVREARGGEGCAQGVGLL